MWSLTFMGFLMSFQFTRSSESRLATFTLTPYHIHKSHAYLTQSKAVCTYWKGREPVCSALWIASCVCFLNDASHWSHCGACTWRTTCTYYFNPYALRVMSSVIPCKGWGECGSSCACANSVEKHTLCCNQAEDTCQEGRWAIISISAQVKINCYGCQMISHRRLSVRTNVGSNPSPSPSGCLSCVWNLWGHEIPETAVTI